MKIILKATGQDISVTQRSIMLVNIGAMLEQHGLDVSFHAPTGYKLVLQTPEKVWFDKNVAIEIHETA